MLPIEERAVRIAQRDTAGNDIAGKFGDTDAAIAALQEAIDAAPKKVTLVYNDGDYTYGGNNKLTEQGINKVKNLDSGDAILFSGPTLSTWDNVVIKRYYVGVSSSAVGHISCIGLDKNNNTFCVLDFNLGDGTITTTYLPKVGFTGDLTVELNAPSAYLPHENFPTVNGVYRLVDANGNVVGIMEIKLSGSYYECVGLFADYLFSVSMASASTSNDLVFGARRLNVGTILYKHKITTGSGHEIYLITKESSPYNSSQFNSTSGVYVNALACYYLYSGTMRKCELVTVYEQGIPHNYIVYKSIVDNVVVNNIIDIAGTSFNDAVSSF